MHEQPVTQPHKKMTQRTMWGLILLIAPSALGILALIMSFVTNYYIDSSDNTTESIMRIVFMIINIIVSITWLPGVVVGIILLATKPNTAHPVTANQDASQTPQSQTVQVTYSPQQLTELAARKTKYLIWGLAALIVPTLSGITAVILLLLNISANFGGSSNDIETTLLTTFSVITGAIAYIGFIPGIVVGILLLVKRTSLQPK